MKIRLKNLLILIILWSIIFLSSQVMAVSLSFNPQNSSINLGESVSLNLVISGLENTNLSCFDLDINYDNSILDFDSYILGTELGVDFTPWVGDAEDWSQGNVNDGVINISEISYLTDFNAQSDSFILATLFFNSIDKGKNTFLYSNVFLGDEIGDFLSYDLNVSNIEVIASVPEPGTIILVCSGLACMIRMRKNNNEEEL